jgi:catechol 2,3-dioxygenase-like lactoylglutathione lyase family enzyme
MGVRRMDNVAIVFADLDAAVGFFAELGLEKEGEAEIEGGFADETVGLDGVRSRIVMMRTPDGHGRLELTQYRAPAAIPGPRDPAPNMLGFSRVMFAVDDIEDTVDRLRTHGGELLGTIARFEDSYRLCYLRGPEGVVIGLAEELS